MSEPLRWTRRGEALTPDAVLARGAAVAALAAATAECLARGAQLRAAQAPGALLVLGSVDDLPWADGVTYLAWEERTLVSTTHTCHPVPSLAASAVRRAGGPTLRAATVVLVPDGAPLLTSAPRGIPSPDQLRELARHGSS